MSTTRTVKLKDIKANPHRSFERYPLREDKVNQLMESIRKTGFWGTLVGRECDGVIQIAYGHHRLAALLMMFPEDMDVEVTIKNLSESQMIKMMGQENAEEWSCPVAATDDAVQAARDYLKANPGAAREALSSGGTEVKRERIGAPAIAAFLGKSQNTVELALERLNLIESGEIDREALYLMPSAAAADRFAKAVKDMSVKIEDQKLVAEKIVENRRFGERSIYETVMERFPREKLKKITDDRASYYDVNLKKATWQITKLRETLYSITAPVVPLIWGGSTTVEDITPEAIESFNRAVQALGESIKKVGEVLDRQPDKTKEG